MGFDFRGIYTPRLYFFRALHSWPSLTYCSRIIFFSPFHYSICFEKSTQNQSLVTTFCGDCFRYDKSICAKTKREENGVWRLGVNKKNHVKCGICGQTRPLQKNDNNRPFGSRWFNNEPNDDFIGILYVLDPLYSSNLLETALSFFKQVSVQVSERALSPFQSSIIGEKLFQKPELRGRRALHCPPHVSPNNVFLHLSKRHEHWLPTVIIIIFWIRDSFRSIYQLPLCAPEPPLQGNHHLQRKKRLESGGLVSPTANEYCLKNI